MMYLCRSGNISPRAQFSRSTYGWADCTSFESGNLHVVIPTDVARTYSNRCGVVHWCHGSMHVLLSPWWSTPTTTDRRITHCNSQNGSGIILINIWCSTKSLIACFSWYDTFTAAYSKFGTDLNGTNSLMTIPCHERSNVFVSCSSNTCSWLMWYLPSVWVHTYFHVGDDNECYIHSEIRSRFDRSLPTITCLRFGLWPLHRHKGRVDDCRNLYGNFDIY